jgi:hypothetical protein
MKRLILAAAALLIGAQAMALETPTEYKTPQGWTVERSTTGVDNVARFVKGARVLQVLEFGGSGSRFVAAKVFLDSFAARSYGVPAKVTAQATVAGASRKIYEHVYPIMLGDPHIPASGPPNEATERFCVVPAGGARFFVLSYAWESPIPDSRDEGDKAWAALLKSFRLKTPASKTPPRGR